MGEAMLQTYRDRLREAMNRRDLSVARLWFAALRDSLRNGPAERLRPAASWRRSGNWGGDAERVVRRVAHTRGRVKRFRRRRTSGLLPGGETRHRNRA